MKRALWAAAACALVAGGCSAPALLATPGADQASAVRSATPSPTPSPARSVLTGRSATPGPARPSPTLGEWRDGAGVAGFDVSRYQPAVDWQGLVSSGHRFVYVKATEGNAHVSPTHAEQRKAARDIGLLQGGYHYARPSLSSGALQARFFVNNGGAWSPDGRTLPGALDLEFAETGDRCHGLGPGQMVGWVREFVDEYERLTGRKPVLYTKAEVWDACTEASMGFGELPLWLYAHGPLPGTLPAGWGRPTLWQRAVEGNLDRNVFFGTPSQLVAWASGPS